MRGSSLLFHQRSSGDFDSIIGDKSVSLIMEVYEEKQREMVRDFFVSNGLHSPSEPLTRDPHELIKLIKIVLDILDGKKVVLPDGTTPKTEREMLKVELDERIGRVARLKAELMLIRENNARRLGSGDGSDSGSGSSGSRSRREGEKVLVGEAVQTLTKILERIEREAALELDLELEREPQAEGEAAWTNQGFCQER